MRNDRAARRRGDRPRAAGIARLSAIITILPASMAAGWLLGYFGIDRWAATFPWASILMTLLGAGAGFYEIVRILALQGNKHDRFPDQRR